MGDDQEQLRQHWQELAEQLGLDDPKQAEAISVPKKEETEPAAAIQAETIKQTEMTKPRSIGSAGNENFIGNETNFVASESETAAGKAPASDQFVAVSETSGDEPPPGSAERPIDDTTQRRGRRGRMPEKKERGRSFPPRRDFGTQSEEETSHLEHNNADEPPKMNGPEAEAGFPEEIEAESDEPRSVEEKNVEDDSDDVDTLSDWNVPSWAELIASLYRPER